ncbi:Nin one binding Zn-ribbon like-domain-containing protein [Globomyces pollinis-pini]|nr:Nin one binding Zn-ribbon like-domain-containing protein [Globomyces pollinis-pini]
MVTATKNIETLVVDSAPIIESAYKLFTLSDQLITVPEVIQELRDKKTLSILESMPFQIITKTPSEQAMKQIIQFSKLTGDFASLSLTDIKVLALTLQLEWEKNGKDHLRTTPLKAKVASGGKIVTQVSGVVMEASNPVNESLETQLEVEPNEISDLNIIDKENQEHSDIQNINNDNLDNFIFQKPKKKGRNRTKKVYNIPTMQEIQQIQIINETLSNTHINNSTDIQSQTDDYETMLVSDSDSDDGDWITPDNLSEHHQQDKYGDNAISQTPQHIDVACITNDFAMQNVLIQMKLLLVTVDGLLIDKLKTWILRCHACFKTTHLMDKVFCPSCGNNTLIRTSCGIDSNGIMTLYLKKKFQYRNRGTVYSIPMTKSGRHANNLILREDQSEHQKALQVKKRLDKKALSQDVSMNDLLAFGQPGARLSSTGNPVIGHGRKNPNASTKKRR